MVIRSEVIVDGSVSSNDLLGLLTKCNLILGSSDYGYLVECLESITENEFKQCSRELGNCVGQWLIKHDVDCYWFKAFDVLSLNCGIVLSSKTPVSGKLVRLAHFFCKVPFNLVLANEIWNIWKGLLDSPDKNAYSNPKIETWCRGFLKFNPDSREINCIPIYWHDWFYWFKERICEEYWVDSPVMNRLNELEYFGDYE